MDTQRSTVAAAVALQSRMRLQPEQASLLLSRIAAQEAGVLKSAAASRQEFVSRAHEAQQRLDGQRRTATLMSAELNAALPTRTVTGSTVDAMDADSGIRPVHGYTSGSLQLQAEWLAGYPPRAREAVAAVGSEYFPVYPDKGWPSARGRDGNSQVRAVALAHTFDEVAVQESQRAARAEAALNMLAAGR